MVGQAGSLNLNMNKFRGQDQPPKFKQNKFSALSQPQNLNPKAKPVYPLALACLAFALDHQSLRHFRPRA